MELGGAGDAVVAWPFVFRVKLTVAKYKLN
jgi:hypothetical protein